MGGFASGISIDNPVLDVTPVPIAVLSPLGSKEVVSCERVAVSCLSRLELGVCTAYIVLHCLICCYS
ncbi:hypothetical protein Leryth_015991 [Lithospermum erythrorhizon]|nr:hypothetical protein Leryth_015991 [Lithospermum erythrorhizon]